MNKRNGNSVKESMLEFLGIKVDSEVMRKIKWLGLLSDKQIKVKNAKPAEILLDLLKQKWALKKDDIDMVILQTEIEYRLENRKEKMISSLIIKGEDPNNTAMSRTVGIPLGIAVNLIMNNKIRERGVVIPVYPDIFKPVLKELTEYGITPKEKIIRK